MEKKKKKKTEDKDTEELMESKIKKDRKVLEEEGKKDMDQAVENRRGTQILMEKQKNVANITVQIENIGEDLIRLKEETAKERKIEDQRKQMK